MYPTNAKEWPSAKWHLLKHTSQGTQAPMVALPSAGLSHLGNSLYPQALVSTCPSANPYEMTMYIQKNTWIQNMSLRFLYKDSSKTFWIFQQRSYCKSCFNSFWMFHDEFRRCVLPNLVRLSHKVLKTPYICFMLPLLFPCMSSNNWTLVLFACSGACNYCYRTQSQ